MKRYTSRGVRERNDGKWELYITDNLRQKRIARTVAAADKEDAKKQQKQLIDKLNDSIETYDANMTVAKVLDDYIEMLAGKGEIESSTLRSYRCDAALAKDYIGGCKLSKLTVSVIDKWLAEARRKYSPRTITRAFNRLKSALKYAQANDLIVKNPCDFTHPPKKAKKAKYELLSDAERARMLKLSLEAIPNPLALSVFLALSIGLRREEVCGLKASDYAENEGVLHVRRVVAIGEGGAYVKDPKTESSARAIPVGGDVKKVLDAVKGDLGNRLRLMGVECDPYLVGEWEPGGRFYHPTQLTKDYAVFRDMNGFPKGVRFHDLRHGWVTLALESGADVATVASYVGHSKPSQTLDVYANPGLEARRRAAEKVDAKLGWDVIRIDDEGTHKSSDSHLGQSGTERGLL